MASIEKLERLLKVKGSVSSTASTAASDDLHQLSKKCVRVSGGDVAMDTMLT